MPQCGIERKRHTELSTNLRVHLRVLDCELFYEVVLGKAAAKCASSLCQNVPTEIHDLQTPITFEPISQSDGVA